MFSPRSLKTGSTQRSIRSIFASHKFASVGLTNVRVRLQIASHYRQEPIISQLTLNYGLVVNITSALLGDNTNGNGYFDLELQGTTDQISQGLLFLKSHNVAISSKPGTSGDGWYY